MKATPIGLIAVLAIAITLMAAPASAEEQMIDFEDLPIGTEIGANYADRGVVFSPGVYIAPDLTEGDQVAWNPSHQNTVITFTPEVDSVSIYFKGAFRGVARAYDADDNLIDKDVDWAQWLKGDKLEVSVDDAPYIAYIKLSGQGDKPLFLHLVVYDDLEYNQIPEFSTIALPIVAIIGLAFLLQRRKD